MTGIGPGLLDSLDAWIDFQDRGYPIVEIGLGQEVYDAIVEAYTDQVILCGDSERVDEVYAREYADELQWQEVQTATGTPSRAWVVTPTAWERMRALKRERGISHYRGIPVRRIEGEAFIVRTARLQAVLDTYARRESPSP